MKWLHGCGYASDGHLATSFFPWYGLCSHFSLIATVVLCDHFISPPIRWGLCRHFIFCLLFLFAAPLMLVLPARIRIGQDFCPKFGVRQGCPLSPLLFCLLISPIVSKLQEQVNNVRILLYADDIMLIFHGDRGPSPPSCVNASKP